MSIIGAADESSQNLPVTTTYEITTHQTPFSDELRVLIETFCDQCDSCWYEECRGWKSCQDSSDDEISYLFVYRERGDILGFALVFNERSSLYIPYIFTAQEHRSKGICTRLMDAIKTSNPERRITLCADSSSLVSMYERLGFQVDPKGIFTRYMFYQPGDLQVPSM